MNTINTNQYVFFFAIFIEKPKGKADNAVNNTLVFIYLIKNA